MNIKNVVFDVGGVLMDFPTHAVTGAFTDGQADADLLHREIFDHPDWLSVDRHLPEATALESMKTHLPQRLHGAAERVMTRWDEWLEPNLELGALIEELSGKGYGVYILSNTSERFYRFRERIPGWPLVKGTLLSFEEKLMKPDPEIFRRLFARFGLTPGECFFVDDSHLNIEAAQWCGMAGSLFRHNTAELRTALRAAGVDAAP